MSEPKPADCIALATASWLPRPFVYRSAETPSAHPLRRCTDRIPSQRAAAQPDACAVSLRFRIYLKMA